MKSLSLGYYHGETHSFEVKFSEQDNWELVEQNPTWSEDDIRLDETIRMVESNGTWVRSMDAVVIVSDWLKSIKQRLQKNNDTERQN